MVWVVANVSGAIGDAGPAMLSLTRLGFLCSSLMRYTVWHFGGMKVHLCGECGFFVKVRSLARSLN